MIYKVTLNEYIFSFAHVDGVQVTPQLALHLLHKRANALQMEGVYVLQVIEIVALLFLPSTTIRYLLSQRTRDVKTTDVGLRNVHFQHHR
jgi:hypothetical protein